MKKSILFTLLFLFLMNATVFAHAMLIDPFSPGHIRVRYADGKFSPDTMITLFDANGQVVYMKKVDENGEFDYSKYAKVDQIMADDNAGHRVMWKVGEQVHNVTGGERWVRMGLAVSVFFNIGLAFYVRVQRRRIENGGVPGAK